MFVGRIVVAPFGCLGFSFDIKVTSRIQNSEIPRAKRGGAQWGGAAQHSRAGLDRVRVERFALGATFRFPFPKLENGCGRCGGAAVRGRTVEDAACEYQGDLF